ncbi:MAG: N-6 DNA methylase, partial [Proteobacteria bacterium]|nr:N-6 DNA methylase [Pseudomonadota bacterium]
MFDQDLDAEKHLIQSSHLDKLSLFLGGHNVQSGQRSLGFWPYNFKMIPIETISAIYQDFLAVEDPEKQRKRGAFYTPRFLAEMVVDMAVRDSPDAFKWSFLDPACGSGIFLVILFNRLANQWIHNAGRVHYVTRAKALRDILARQIRGVDFEETACRIACFSLYLAYLDFFDPPDIQDHIKKIGHPLPKLLDYGDNPDHPVADIPVIHKSDFLDRKTIVGETFDCIIGNPPWEGRQNKQLAQKFMQEAPRFLQNGGTGCLLLPTKMLQNQTDTFQAEWLQRVTLEKVMQLADYRRLLFQNAKTPAFIARFKNTPPEPAQHLVEFAAPKFNRDGLRQGIVTINPSTRTWIPLADILAATQSKTAPVVWKRRLWGTPRDQKLLDLLQSLPPLSDLAGAPKEGKRWIKGQGFQPYYPEKAKNNKKYPKPKPNPWKLDALFVRAEPYIQMILFDSDCTILGERLGKIGASIEHLRMAPNAMLFKAPMILISQGFSKIAYCDFDVLFQHSLQSIAGSPEDADLLMFLTAYLRSNLARYFLFHTSANWGSERDKVHLSELLRVPFPLPGSEFVSTNAGQIVKQVAKKIGQLRNKLDKTLISIKSDVKRHSLFDEDETAIKAAIKKEWRQKRKGIVNTLQKELEPLIYRYFGLTDQEITLIEDTIRVFEPSSTPTTRWSSKTVTLDPAQDTTVEPYASQGLSAYADTLTETLNTWAKTEGSRYRVCAEGGTDDQTGLAMVTLTLSSFETDYHSKSLSQYLMKVLKEFHKHASRKRGTLHYERDILFFQEDRIHIVRPNILLNWTRTAALNDAARIYGEIILADKEP